jgi:hypothetical protein
VASGVAGFAKGISWVSPCLAVKAIETDHS